MRLSEIFRFVMINIRQNKSKVFLTSLGIIVGTATIVMVIAIGEGGKQDVAEQFKTLNAGTITVSAGSNMAFGMEGMMQEMMQNKMQGMSGMPSGGLGGSSGRSGGGGPSSGGGKGGSAGMKLLSSNALNMEQLEDVLFFVPDISTGAIQATTENTLLGGSLEEEIDISVVGTQSTYQQISNLELLIGSFLSEEELENEVRCVVLGYTTAMEIFDSLNDAYDSKVEIDGRTYVVNGVLAQVGTVVSGIAPDTSVFMPYTTADRYLFGSDTEPQFSILATDVDTVATVMENIQLVLEQSNPDGQYTITDAGATMDAAMQSANTLSMLLLAVAIIVFIVGGIGIMNVLFVSVKERTREIGVLRAIGTRKGDILLLFLVEAGMMGFIGGIVGIGLSFLFVPFMEKTDITVVMTSSSIVIAFAFAVVTSTIFGFYPAKKAANLIPIDALNND